MPAHLIAEEGPLTGLILNFDDQDQWIIGRDPDQSDFVLEDTTVSRKHAEASRGTEGIFVRNLSKINPTLINEEEISGQVLLKEGDRVRIGQTTFLFSEEEPLLEQEPSTEKKKDEKNYEEIFSGIDEIPEEVEPLKEPSKDIYDTIFEEGEEDPSFSLMNDTPFLLKVISGPNAGAEIGIEKGKSYVIGKDPNSCEIVFQDLSVSRNHARLTVDTKGTLTIEDLDSKNSTRLNGAIIEEKKLVTSQDLIACGTTTFIILDRNAAQETIYSPSFPSYEEEIVEEEPEEIEEVLPVHWKEKIIPTKYLFAIGSFVVVFFIVFISFFSLFKTQQVKIVKKMPAQKIQEALKKYEDLEFSYNPTTQKLFLTGHVLTNVDQQELLYNLKSLPFISSIDNHIVIDEYVWKNINQVLTENANWKGVNVYALKAGNFVISGYLETMEEKDQLDDYLNTHFPFLNRLDNQVFVEQMLTLQIQSDLIQGGFSGIAFQLNNGELTLSGLYDEKKQKPFNELVNKLNQIQGVRSIQNIAVAATESASRIDLSQNYQVNGYAKYDSKNYSVVINGKILTLGDSLDGMDVTSILKHTILLEKDGLKYKIDYNP